MTYRHFARTIYVVSTKKMKLLSSNCCPWIQEYTRCRPQNWTTRFNVEKISRRPIQQSQERMIWMLSLRKNITTRWFILSKWSENKKKSLDFGLCSQPDNNTIEGQDIWHQRSNGMQDLTHKKFQDLIKVSTTIRPKI